MLGIKLAHIAEQLLPQRISCDDLLKHMCDDVHWVEVLCAGTLWVAGGGRGLGGQLGTEGQHHIEQVEQKVTDAYFSCGK